MAEDKAKLLKSLRIERSAETPAAPRRRRWPAIAAVEAAAVNLRGEVDGFLRQVAA